MIAFESLRGRLNRSRFEGPPGSAAMATRAAASMARSRMVD
jgi:hypothetical protein